MKKVMTLSVAFLVLSILPVGNLPSDTSCEIIFPSPPPRLWAEENTETVEDEEHLQDIDLGETGLEDFVLFICRILDVQVVYEKQMFGNKKYMFKFQPQPLSNLFPLLRDTLDIYGFRLLSMGDEEKPIYYVFNKSQPASFEVPPPRMVKDGEEVRPDQMIVKFMKLEYADANYLVSQIRALSGVNQQALHPYPATNEIAITDFPDQVEYYENLIRERDVEEAKLKTVVVELHHVKSAVLLEVVTRHLEAVTATTDAKPKAGGTAVGMGPTYRSMVRFTPVEEPNKIIFTAPEHEATKLEEFIRKFDVAIKAPEKEVVTKIYMVKHIDLEEAAEIIAQVFDGENISIGGDDYLADGVSSEVDLGGEAPPAGSLEIEGANGSKHLLEEFERPTVVVQSHATALVITTSLRVHGKIQELLAALDIKTPQVYLEAALVSVAYDTNLTVATELSTIELLRSGPQVFSATDFGLSQLTPVPSFALEGRKGFRKGGLIFGVAKDNANVIPGLIRLSRTTSKVKVLSNPSVFADNNREAVFTTEDQQPYGETKETSSGSTITTRGGVETASIEIRIRPVIFEGDTLRLNITLKVEAFTGPPPNENLSPPKTSNVYTGTLSVADGRTVVLGGLVTDRESVTETKVPLLGDIPLLGYLFKSQVRIKDKSVLYIFITPKIMKEAGHEDLEKLRQEKEGKLDQLKGGKKQ